MVKFRGKPKKKQEPHVAGETGVVQSYVAPKKGVSGKVTAPARSFRRMDKTGKLLVTLLIALVGAVVYFGVISNSNTDTSKDVIHLPTEQEGLKGNLDKLKDNAPKQTATKAERVAYLDKLIIAYVNVEDYEGAVKTFEQRQNISEEGLDYVAYITAAMYYHEIGDDESAVLLLKRAETMLPANDDFERGYSRQSVLEGLQKLKKDYES